MTPVRVIGAGPAGTSAALAALNEGAAVEVFEKTLFPRHKVCGEFLSPETVPLLQELGVWNDLKARNPAPMRRMLLHFGRAVKRGQLPEPAWGLSRHTLDDLLLRAAIARGATLVRAKATPGEGHTVIATGRAAAAPRGKRLFGFKAHFRGPVDDAVALYFARGLYIGVNPIEDGVTNVCGLAPEDVLRQYRFDPDLLIASLPALRDRLRSLTPIMDWLNVGPLVFANRFRAPSPATHYYAGDALSFVDPFTGSGMLSALLTGISAGRAAARAIPAETHQAHCRRALASPFGVASALRKIALSGWAGLLAPLAPAPLLFRYTRPHAG